jgi:quercetin dioxygenase-like cupin family protein
MPELNRRSLLYAFGIASLTPLLSAETASSRRVAVAKPGENRYKYANFQAQLTPPCTVTSEDSAGGISVFEMTVAPRSGPQLHVHHREDETYYVLSGEFLFEVGGQKHSLPQGATIFAPRDIPHRWANVSTSDSKMILVCTPGGFEKFFEDSAMAMMDKASPAQMDQIMAKYGCEPLGPPLFP